MNRNECVHAVDVLIVDCGLSWIFLMLASSSNSWALFEWDLMDDENFVWLQLLLELIIFYTKMLMNVTVTQIQSLCQNNSYSLLMVDKF